MIRDSMPVWIGAFSTASEQLRLQGPVTFVPMARGTSHDEPVVSTRMTMSRDIKGGRSR